jgi:iron complex outermembrane receptor protein
VGGVIYQIGGFYFKEQLNRENGFFLPIGPNGTFLSYFDRNVTSDSKSLFGQVEVPVAETVTFVGGLRYTKNSRDAVYLNGGPFFNAKADIYKGTTPPPGGAPDSYLFNAGSGRKDFSKMKYLQTLLLGSEEDKITWLAGVNYKPNSDTLIFAKASTGFKGGGFDSVGVYKPETNTAYELGWKQSFGDHSQHQFNLGGFYYDYKDLQVSVLLDTTVGGQTFNAGKAKIWGIEASGDFKLSDNDTFSVSANYLNAEYKDLKAQFNVYTVPGTGADVNGIGDLDPNTAGIQQPNFAGNRPAFSPEWVITVGYDHVFDLASAGTVTASAFTTFKSSYFTDFYNYRDGQQKAFTQTDLSLLWKPESGKFSVQAFVKNLEDERPVTYGSFVSAGSDDIYNWQFGTPRTYGVRLSVDF